MWSNKRVKRGYELYLSQTSLGRRIEEGAGNVGHCVSRSYEQFYARVKIQFPFWPKNMAHREVDELFRAHLEKVTGKKADYCDYALKKSDPDRFDELRKRAHEQCEESNLVANAMERVFFEEKRTIEAQRKAVREQCMTYLLDHWETVEQHLNCTKKEVEDSFTIEYDHPHLQGRSDFLASRYGER